MVIVGYKCFHTNVYMLQRLHLEVGPFEIV